MRQPHRPIIDPDKLRMHTDGARVTLGTLRTHAVDLLSLTLDHLGFPATLRDQIPDNLAALTFARGQSIRNTVRRWGGDVNGDDEIAIVILPVPDASFISKIRSEVSSLQGRTREIYIALVGDMKPVGLQDGAIPIGFAGGTEHSGADAHAGALEMVRKRSTYVLAAASPPDVKTVEAVVSTVKLAVARLESSNNESFRKFRSSLLRAARVVSPGPPARRPQEGAPQ